MMKCLWRHCSNELSGQQIKFCSRKCCNKYNVDKIRKGVKKKAVEYKGGSCIKCGYNKCITALVFHHREADTKDFTVGQNPTIVGKK